MARLYADEDVPAELVESLRNLGHDVVAVVELGRSSDSDAKVLADATADGRTVLTFNRWDYGRLHRNDPSHAGIASCTRDHDIDALAARINQAIAGPLAGRHVRVNRPAQP